MAANPNEIIDSTIPGTTKSSTTNPTIGRSPSTTEASNDDQQNSKKSAPLTPGELSRPTNIQRIQQKKTQVKALSQVKKLEKLAVYSSCKVKLTSIYFGLKLAAYLTYIYLLLLLL